MPALLTRMSSPPSNATVSSTLERASSGSAASARRNRIAPRGVSADSASAPSCSSRPVITTEAPSSRNRSAIARPSPVVPPVINAALSASSGIDREPLVPDRQRHGAPAARALERLGRDLGALQREREEARPRTGDTHRHPSEGPDPVELVGHLRDELETRVLMQAVAERLLKKRGVVRQRFDQQRCVPQVEDRVGDRDALG